jgi:predicted neuraminidase
MRLLFLFIVLLALVSCQTLRIPKSCDIKVSENIFETAPFDQCHASTLIELQDGSLMASWFAGSYEGSKDVAIWASVKKGNSWTSPVPVANGKANDSLQYPCWNPVLFRNSKNVLFLFYKVGPNPREWWGMQITSTDEGKTWSKPARLPKGILGPIKNKPILLKSGVILSPSSTETNTRWQSFIERSEDGGKSWQIIPVDTANPAKVIQPTLLLYPQGKIQALLRSNQDYIMESWSADEGKTWSALQKTNVLNPNSGIDAVTLSSGLQVLVYNPMQSGTEWVNGRNKLNVAVSVDGINWKDIAELENQPEGEFSYPSVIETSDKKVHVVYTANRKWIRHVVIDFP